MYFFLKINIIILKRLETMSKCDKIFIEIILKAHIFYALDNCGTAKLKNNIPFSVTSE